MFAWLTVREGARRVGVSTQRVYAVVRSGQVRSMKMGATVFVFGEDIECWRRRRGRTGTG